MQIASFGFLGGYLAVCVAAPFYLATKSRLGATAIAVAVATVSIICAVFFMSLVPVPDAPWRYLPYIFAGLILAGVALSAFLQRGRPGGPATVGAASRTAG
jgi:hypothetical protein